LLIGLVIAESTQLSGTSKYAILNGWTFNTWLIATIQAAGGLLVAATLKYADAVLKTLATSGAIVLSAVLGWFLLGGTLDIFITVGCVATILAIFNYILDDQS
jgi:UDP-sugar transporter A1/2/3